MANKMLIDASHREETRVVVMRGNRIEEFDFEAEARKQLRGNIYLARVTRVEPSLQAAFVEYGGNRHGFLAFSEIHPDYYQIPVADRQALLEQEAEEARQQDAEDDENSKEKSSSKKGRGRRRRGGSNAKNAKADKDAATDNDDEAEADVMAAEIVGDFVSDEPEDNNGNGDDDDSNGDDDVESVGAEDAMEEVPDRRRTQRRQYRIQEVIKRRQILLVQVVKEERGNKGAALTTYLSLAGRYSVLMPNTARGGGISRKITQLQDRKRLKDVVHSLDVPQGMGVILRTAGANRTKAEIKRDYEYLMRMWETVRNLTLQSTAPCLVYEEGSLIKRAIRDLYNKDIDEILVAGDNGYREAKDFMRMLMPSHAKAVQPYRDTLPIFARNGIEGQLDKMLQPQVTLKSGGYIIINQTEALVSIDVNSGRSTREHSIEDTALQTNLEAAEEVARQLRLRDLAGLIVIDFIDMDEKRNNRSVEKRMKDCLKQDRARIQVGRISHFGLLEMSRQRIRASVLESTMKTCPHCGGIGLVRSDSSEALHVIRSIEEHLLKNNAHDIVVRTSTHTALYILNHKRTNIQELEQRFGLHISLEADDTLGHVHYAIDRGEPASGSPTLPAGTEAVQIDYQEDEAADEAAAAAAAAAAAEDDDDDINDNENENDGDSEADGDGSRRKRRRRRRRRGGGGDEERSARNDGDDSDDRAERDDNDGEPRRRRRRGKRGGRRNRRDFQTPQAELVGWSDEEIAALKSADAGADDEPTPADGNADDSARDDTAAEAKAETQDTADDAKPKRGRRSRRKSADADSETASDAPQEPVEAKNDADGDTQETAPEPDAATEDSPKAPEPEPQQAAEESEPQQPAKRQAVVVEAESIDATEKSDRPKRSGWWQKRSFF